MQKWVFFLLLQALSFTARTQVAENFEDGDFTANPAWTTTSAADWTVNSNRQLQSNNTTANSSFSIVTGNTHATATQWEFWVRLAFNPSGANYVDVYLTASAGNLSLNSTTGYFVRIGHTQDEISLYRKDANGTIIKLIDGTDGITDRTNNVLRIKVVRTGASQFTLLRDAGGSGNSFVREGAATDATYTASAFFGFLVRQSTPSFFQRHFFDDIEVKAYVPDVTPPVILSATALSSTTVDVLFSEPVELASSQTVAHYAASNGIGVPVSALRSNTNPALVQLTFASAFANGTNYTLTANGVTDLWANTTQNATAIFLFYTPQAYDVVIDEIMADPAPPVNLPNAEFIELKNVSGRSINLQGWRLLTASASSGAFPAYNLPADSFLIITSTSAAAQLVSYGRALGVGSFPSLPNDGGLLQILSREGRTIHTVNYTAAWYQDAAKAAGGWTLEMIDTGNPCSGAGNWRASTDPQGGTPGKKNSVDGNNSDTSPPQLLRNYSLDSVTIIAVFNEPLDSVSASVASHYAINNNLTISGAGALPPLFNKVMIRLGVPMQKGTVYTLTASSVMDCRGNVISNYNKARAGWAEEASAGDVVVNEVLFDPKPNAYDYVEFYNRSKKVLDASQMFLANRSSTGTVASQRRLGEEPFLFFPGDYLVATQDKASLLQQYLVKEENAVLSLSSLPSYPNDKGAVVLLGGTGEVIDEVSYDKDWHFALINDAEGVALERIDPEGPSQDRNNWHSAASTAGYGTPTYKNSQYKAVEEIKATVSVSPPVFSPDNDGRDDLAIISYRVQERGFVANVLIFDAAGRLVRQLVRNNLLSLNGTWKWDGLGDKQNKLPIGTYIVFTEIFNTDGKRKSFKNTVVLARQLN